MVAATSDVCFTPDSDHKSGHVTMIMSALPPKADVCSAIVHVCFGPIADIARHSINSSARERSEYGIVRPRALAVVRLIIN